MSWLVLTLIAVFIVSLSNVYQRVLFKHKDSDPVLYTIFFAFLLSCINITVSGFWGFNAPALNLSFLYFVLSAVLWGIGTIFLFKAMKEIEASEVTIIVSLRIIVIMMGSVIFLQQSLDVFKILGAIIVFIAIVFVANIKKGVKFSRGITYALIVTFFYGTAPVVDAHVLRSFDVFSYLTVVNVLIFFVLIVIFPKTVLKWREYTRADFLLKLVPLALLSSSQAYAYLFAVQRGPLLQIAPINQTQVIVTVLFAAVLLGERDNLIKKLIAALLVVVGVYLLR